MVRVIERPQRSLIAPVPGLQCIYYGFSGQRSFELVHTEPDGRQRVPYRAIDQASSMAIVLFDVPVDRVTDVCKSDIVGAEQVDSLQALLLWKIIL